MRNVPALAAICLAVFLVAAGAADRPLHKGGRALPPGNPIIYEGATIYVWPAETPPPGDPAAFTVAHPAVGDTVTGAFPVSGVAGTTWKNVACYSAATKVTPDMAPDATSRAWNGSGDSTRMPNGTATPLVCTAFSTLPGVAGGTNKSVTVNLNVANAAPPSDHFTIGGYTFGSPTFEDDFKTLSIAGNVGSASSQFKWYASGHNFGATVSCCTNTNEPGNTEWDPYSLISGGGLAIRAHNTANGWRTGLMSTVAGDGTGFKAMGGYWEASFKFPTEPRGTWPGWWMLSSPNGNGNPPQTAEADIFETFGTCGPANNGQLNRAIGTAFHSWNMPPDGHHTATGHDSMLDFDMSAGYHTYGMLWNGTEVQIYVDRKMTHSEATPSVMHQPMYAIVNLGMNACDDIGYAHDPSELDVKYVKIWTFPDVNGKGF